MAWTLVEIDTMVVDIKAAYKASISGKSYSIDTGGTSRSVTRNDAQSLLNQLQYWETQRINLVNGSSGGIPTKFITPTGI